jgi:glutamyl-tRNA synthetase
LKDLEGMGYLPEAVVNWIALMGWSYDDHTEFFTLEDLVEKFSIDNLNPSPQPSIIPNLTISTGCTSAPWTEDLAQRVKPFLESAGYAPDDDTLLKVAPLIQKRILTLEDAPSMAGFFFKDEVHPSPEILVGQKLDPVQSAKAARRAYEILAGLDAISHETAEQPLRALAEELGMSAGQLFGMMRAAVTGQTVSPPLFESMEVIGREKVLERIQECGRNSGRNDNA